LLNRGSCSSRLFMLSSWASISSAIIGCLCRRIIILARLEKAQETYAIFCDNVLHQPVWNDWLMGHKRVIPEPGTNNTQPVGTIEKGFVTRWQREYKNYYYSTFNKSVRFWHYIRYYMKVRIVLQRVTTRITPSTTSCLSWAKIKREFPVLVPGKQYPVGVGISGYPALSWCGYRNWSSTWNKSKIGQSASGGPAAVPHRTLHVYLLSVDCHLLRYLPQQSTDGGVKNYTSWVLL
jgi:hypothetical protein